MRYAQNVKVCAFHCRATRGGGARFNQAFTVPPLPRGSGSNVEDLRFVHPNPRVLLQKVEIAGQPGAGARYS